MFAHVILGDTNTCPYPFQLLVCMQFSDSLTHNLNGHPIHVTLQNPILKHLWQNYQSYSKCYSIYVYRRQLQQLHQYPTHFSVTRIKGEAATAASVKHKCYSLTPMMHYLKISLYNISIHPRFFTFAGEHTISINMSEHARLVMYRFVIFPRGR